MNKKRCGIYEIVSKAGKKYIGSTKQSFNIRWSLHKQQLKKNIHHSKHLQNSWNKHGASWFEFKVIEVLPADSTKVFILEREQYWIDFYKSYKPNNGYNISKIAGSTMGLVISKRKFMARTKDNKIHIIDNGLLNFCREHNTKATNCKKLTYKNIINSLSKNKVYNCAGIVIIEMFEDDNFEEIVHKLSLIKISNKYSEKVPKKPAPRIYYLYILESPEGLIYHTSSLNAFCNRMDLRYETILEICKREKGDYKGWKASRQIIK